MLKIVGTALFAAAVIAGSAQAESKLIRTDVEVSYHDLDLSTEIGAKALLTRIDTAAREACGGNPYFYTTYSVAPSLANKEFATCHANAVNTAVNSIKAPLVQQLLAANPHYTRVASGV